MWRASMSWEEEDFYVVDGSHGLMALGNLPLPEGWSSGCERLKGEGHGLEV